MTDLYKRQCALTNSHVLHVLDAAHIRPYAEGGTHSPSYGLLLRQDVHTLFDKGYLTINPEYGVEVSRTLKASPCGRMVRLLESSVRGEGHPTSGWSLALIGNASA